MSVFVSGATGYIGIQLVKRLSEMGLRVHALYRSEEKVLMIPFNGVHHFKGDILDIPSLEAAMKGCSEAYHVAALAGIWPDDPSLFYRHNVEGALNVVRVAIRAGVRRVVVTSTAGILGPSTHGQTVDENNPPPDSFFSTYESSKYQMEQELKKIKPEEFDIVTVNPTRVYGPGLLSVSNGVTKMIKMYLKDNWRYLPGNGYQYGNYAFVEDVVTGLLLAMERGKPGERYILGGENLTYRQLFKLVRETSNIKRKLYQVPLWLMLIFAAVIKSLSRITGRPPLIVPQLVRKFNHHWIVSSEKAIHEIGYNPVTAEKGIGTTVKWINENF